MTDKERPLTVIERLLYGVCQAFNGDGIPVFTARCSGTWDEPRFRAALAAVQRRHPLLQCRIVEHKHGWPRFQWDVDAPCIPVEIHEPAADTGWEQAALNQSQRRFDVLQAPLCRISILPRRHGDGFDLVAAIHHAIIDGLSMLALLRELLEQMATPRQDHPVDSLEMTFRVMQTPTLAQRGRVLAKWIGKTISQQIWRPQIIPADADSPGHCIRLVWPKSQTAALIQRCRVEGTTFYGALSASLLHSVSTRSDMKDVLHLMAPFDIRPMYRTAVDRQTLGCFVGILDFVYQGTRSAGFWELARRCHRDVLHEQSWLMPNSWDAVMSGVPFTKPFLQPLRKLTVGVNNLGKCTPIAAGPWRVEEFSWFGRSQHLGASIAANAVTINDCLNLTLQGDRMSRESLLSLGSEILKRLDAAAARPEAPPLVRAA